MDTPRIVTVFKERMEERLKTLAKGGRTPALWVWYYGRIDLIKVFIRSERVPDHTGHLSCIIGMLNTFAALDVLEYGLKQGEQGYAPVPTTDPIAPDYLLKFVSCNCAGDCDL